MTFYWICPHCQGKNFYSGSKTTNVVVICKGCKKQVKASSHKKPEKKEEKPRDTTDKLPKTIDKLPIDVSNGSLESLVIAMNYAINTIKFKKPVIDKDVNSTWYQHFLSWTKWRKTFQMGLLNRE